MFLSIWYTKYLSIGSILLGAVPSEEFMCLVYLLTCPVRGIVDNSDLCPCVDVTFLERKNKWFVDAKQLFTHHNYVREEKTNNADSALFRVLSTAVKRCPKATHAVAWWWSVA